MTRVAGRIASEEGAAMVARHLPCLSTCVRTCPLLSLSEDLNTVDQVTEKA